MAACVGYTIQSLGVTFPGQLTRAATFADISAAGAADQWDALPAYGKLQIIGVVGLLEVFGESSVLLGKEGKEHYMRGGTPGYYPRSRKLFDPIGLTTKLSAEKKEKSLLAELNNGRLAMLGIIGLVSASKGCIVPGLDSLPIKPYTGEIMAPFSTGDEALPLVEAMLKLPPFMI